MGTKSPQARCAKTLEIKRKFFTRKDIENTVSRSSKGIDRAGR